MSIVEGNIEALTQAIMGEARAETQELRSRAQAQADEILRRAQDQAERERAGIVEHARQEAVRLQRQAVSTAEMQARALELDHREQLLEKAFAAAAERLKAVPAQKDYPVVVKRLLGEAVGQVPVGSLDVLADRATLALLSKTLIDEISKDTGSTLATGKTLGSGIGVVVRTSDGRLQFDNTLETRLSRLKGVIRSAVHRELLGGSE